jgi:hypothetical protein
VGPNYVRAEVISPQKKNSWRAAEISRSGIRIDETVSCPFDCRSLRDFAGHLVGGGVGGQVGMGLGTGFGHEFRTPGRFAFRQANRFRGRAFARNDHFFPKDRFFVNRRFFPNRFFPAHRFFRSNVVFVGFGFPYSYYPYSYYPDDPYLNNDYEPNYDEQGYDYQYWNESAQPAQSEFMRRGNYNAPIQGISSFGSLWPMESPNGYGSIGVGGQDLKVMPEPNEATGAPALSVESVTPPASNTQDT